MTPSIRDRVKAAASSAAERATSGSERARTAASNAESAAERRAAAARDSAARAARRAGTSGPVGRARPEVNAVQESRSGSRTKAMFARAEEYATVNPAVDISLDPSPDGEEMWAFVTGGRDPAPNQAAWANEFTDDGEPSWGSNPEHLDTSSEVREDLSGDGLDPVDVDSENRAEFGHYLVHKFANTPGMGGRTPEQLEAEHDMVVEALDEHGVDHDSPLMFDDPFGVTADGVGGEGGWL